MIKNSVERIAYSEEKKIQEKLVGADLVSARNE